MSLDPVSMLAGAVCAGVLGALSAVRALRSDRRKLTSLQKEFESRGVDLHEANEIRTALINSSPLAIWAIDLEGRVILWNIAAEKIFGWTAAEVLHKPLPAIREEEQNEFQQWLDRSRQGEFVVAVERTRLRKDGSKVEVAIWTAPLHDAGGAVTGVLKLDADITHRKQIENQFRQAQKLEAVGRLAGGVAHDFNNLLTVILGYVDLILLEAKSGTSVNQYATEVRGAATRASGLTAQLLTFSRRQISQPKVVEMNSIVSNSITLLSRVIGEDIRIHTQLAADLGKVKADPIHLEQIVMNLAVNARDAMNEGGSLYIETANAILDQEYCAGHPDVPPGAYVLLAVTDSGCGMTAETRARLFEPFFTTKDQGRGTGLGLSIVYGIVKQNGGEVIVYSEPGRGTSFKVYFPMVEGDEEFVAAQTRASALRGSETILVCEDEEHICKLVNSMLKRQGYRVLTADNPDEALRVAEAHGEPIDLLLTDIVLRQSSGFELAAQLSARQPGVRILYMSGYADSRIKGAPKLEDIAHFLRKPFTAESLAEKVRETFEAASPAPLAPQPEQSTRAAVDAD